MKNLTIKLAVPVLLSLFVALTATAQTPAPTKASSAATNAGMSKQDRINDANKRISMAQEKINNFKAKHPTATEATTLQNDLNAFKSATTAYSSSKGDAQEKSTGDQLKTANEKLTSDWKAAEAKYGAAKPNPAPKP